LPSLLSALALAFIALAEDANVFFEDGESFIGDMLEKYPEWAGEIRTVASVLQKVYDLTMMIFDGWDKIFGLFREEGADAMNQALKDKGLGFLTKEIGITDEQSGPVNDILKNMGLGFLTREIGVFDSGTLDTPLTSKTSTSTIVEKLEILVNGSGQNPDDIAQSVYDEFLQQTYQDLNSAVDQ
jgi:hypothetical protein